MATTSSSPEVTLVVCPARPGRHEPLRLRLRERDTDDTLVQATGAYVVDDTDYTFRLELTETLPPCRATLTINGELVAFGDVSADDTGETGLALRRIGTRPPFFLIFGFVRAELRLAGETLECRLTSDDVAVLMRGDGESERARIDAMLETLTTPDDTALSWMLAGGMAEETERMSIIEGSLVEHATVDLTSFMRLTEEVLCGFEETLQSFRQHVAKRVSTTPVRLPRTHVTRISATETLWIAHNPASLEQVAHPSPITDGTRSFLPRHIEAKRRCESFDLYENRCILSFLRHLTHRLGHLEHLLRTQPDMYFASGIELMVQPNGYFAPTTLVGDAIRARSARRHDRLRQFIAHARKLVDAYGRALPEVETHGSFRPPRQTKIFLESAPYQRLFSLICRWCEQGSISLTSGDVALRTHRLDTLFERYALHELLETLIACGFDADPTEEAPFTCVSTYVPGTLSAATDICNRYLLACGDTRLQLLVEPALAADEGNDTYDTAMPPLRRTTSTASGKDTPFVPDFCLRVRQGDGIWEDIILDAKYRHVAGVMRQADRTLALPGGGMAQLTEMQAALIKYKLSVVAADTGRSPHAVWLLCGRDDTAALDRFEGSSFSRANPDLVVPSGSCSLSPTANVLGELLSLLGITPAHER